MAAYSLIQSDIIHGDKEVFQEFRDRVINDANKTVLGSSYLSHGSDFWGKQSEIGNLKNTPEKKDLPISANTTCNIKNAIMRPIQNSVQGLALMHEIKETNTLKTLDILMEKGVIDSRLGNKLINAYQFSSSLRKKMELINKEESVHITRHPNHFIAKTRKAYEIDDQEYKMILEINETLDELHQIVNLAKEK